MSTAPVRTEQATVEELAAELWLAEASRSPIPPLTDSHPDLSVAEAYAIQIVNRDRRLAEGERLIGHKIGLTSKPMQQQLGVDEPDFGGITDRMTLDDGDRIPPDELIKPRIEAEIAFVLGRDLHGPGVTTLEAHSAIVGALPSLEVIDSRVENWTIKLADTIADNASSARVILGAGPVPIEGRNLLLEGLALYRNGELDETGAGAAAFGNPVRCVAWLANKLAEVGDHLRAGGIVLSGSLHRSVAVEPGDVFRADFTSIGSVSVRF